MRLERNKNIFGPSILVANRKLQVIIQYDHRVFIRLATRALFR